MAENEKRIIDWNAIRAEYIAGGIGQRNLAKKYGVSEHTLISRAKAESWTEVRDKARNEITEKSLQKVANAAATNAVIAQRIREKLLLRLEREIDALPDSIGTNKRKAVTEYEYDGKRPKKQKDIATEYKLKDLTSAWKDLTEGLVIAEKTEETADDGFLDALKGTAVEDWADADEDNDI